MNLQEVQERLKKTTINEDQLWDINSLYILLDLHKDDFCKIIDLVGLDKLLAKKNHYDRLFRAEQELAAKEFYLMAKSRLAELEYEREQLSSIVNNYNPLD